MSSGILRGVPWAPVLAASLVAGLLLVLSVIWPDQPISPMLFGLGLAALASAGCFVLDEPAAEAVDASPVTLRRRSLTRMWALTVPLVIGVAAAAARESRLAESTAWGTVLELVGLLVVGVTAASLLRRRGHANPGEVAATGVAAVVLMLVVKDPLSRWVPVLPQGLDPHWNRTVAMWLVVLVSCSAALMLTTRDSLARYRSPTG